MKSLFLRHPARQSLLSTNTENKNTPPCPWGSFPAISSYIYIPPRAKGSNSLYNTKTQSSHLYIQKNSRTCLSEPSQCNGNAPICSNSSYPCMVTLPQVENGRLFTRFTLPLRCVRGPRMVDKAGGRDILFLAFLRLSFFRTGIKSVLSIKQVVSSVFSAPTAYPPV